MYWRYQLGQISFWTGVVLKKHSTLLHFGVIALCNSCLGAVSEKVLVVTTENLYVDRSYCKEVQYTRTMTPLCAVVLIIPLCIFYYFPLFCVTCKLFFIRQHIHKRQGSSFI